MIRGFCSSVPCMCAPITKGITYSGDRETWQLLHFSALYRSMALRSVVMAVPPLSPGSGRAQELQHG